MGTFDTLEEWTEDIVKRRYDFPHSEAELALTDEEFLIVCLAIADKQKLINKCRYSAIEKLISDGWLVEVWLPYTAHDGQPVIRPAWEVSEAHQSTNRP